MNTLEYQVGLPLAAIRAYYRAFLTFASCGGSEITFFFFAFPACIIDALRDVR
jgi:hypothetical protein